jgi:hypothetical protein
MFNRHLLIIEEPVEGTVYSSGVDFENDKEKEEGLAHLITSALELHIEGFNV